MKLRSIFPILAWTILFSSAQAAEIVERPGAGYALSFDGSSELVISDLPADFPISLEMWVKWDGTTNASNRHRILELGSNTDGFTLFHDNNGRLHLEGRVGGALNEIEVREELNLQTDAWTFFRLSFIETNNFFITLNNTWGESFNSSRWATAMSYNLDLSQPLVLGGDTDGFQGHIDELRIFQEDFPQDREIIATMCLQLDPTSFGALRSYYRFDQGAGNEVFDWVDQSIVPLSGANSPSWVVSGAPIGDQVAYTEGVDTYYGERLELPDGALFEYYSGQCRERYLFQSERGRKPHCVDGTFYCDRSRGRIRILHPQAH